MSIQDSIGPADRSKAREQINCWLIVVSAEESDVIHQGECFYRTAAAPHIRLFSQHVSPRRYAKNTLLDATFPIGTFKGPLIPPIREDALPSAHLLDRLPERI